MFEILFEKFNNFYEKIFLNYGLFVAKYYKYTIVISFLINILLSFGLFKLNLITDSDELFSVTDSKAKSDEGLLKQIFISNTDYYEKKFFLHQLLDFGTWGEINIHVKNEIVDKNIINETYFDEIRHIHDQIVNNVTTNSSLKLNDTCARRLNKCVIDGDLLLNKDFFEWLQMKAKELENGEIKLNEPTDMLNSPYAYQVIPEFVDLKFVLGKNFDYILNVNTTKTKNHGYPAYATLFKLRYSLKSNYANMDPSVKEWEMAFVDFMKNVKLKYLTFTFSGSHSIESEMLNNVNFDVHLVATTFILITVFATILMSFKTNLITSPGFILPSAGILSAAFACTSSIGFMSLINYSACNLVFVIPFLVLGIGIDDMFIIYSSFMYTNPESSTEERISIALKKSGVSITITSVTDFIAFMVGLFASFKSVQIFSVYAAVAILFCYFYQLTFFCGMLVIHSNRIKANRNTFLWCIKHKIKQNEENKIDEQNEEIKNDEPNFELVNSNKEQNKDQVIKKIDNNRRNKINSTFSNFYKFVESSWTKLYKFLLFKKIGKLIVFILFCIYISFFSYNMIKIREGINLGDLVADNSYYRAYIMDNVESVNLFPMVMLVVTKPVDYTNATIKEEIRSILDEAKQIDGISKNFEFNWMNIYDKVLDDYKDDLNGSVLLEIKKDIFPFSNDAVIEFNNNTRKYEIIASRFYLQFEYLKFNSDDAIPMNELRRLCKSSSLPIIPYAISFKIYEQFEETIPNVIQAFIIALEAMYLVSLLFIPDLVSILCILVSMISIMIGMVGSMHLWDLTLSSVTMIQLVMSVGFCIDFSAHLTHAFIASVEKGSRSERAYKACMRTGLPIFNSAVSTIIGVCVLAFCKSYIFVSFFKTLFIVMCLGVLNSMLFLPVLLSLVGPDWKRHKVDKAVQWKQDETNAIENKPKTSNF